MLQFKEDQLKQHFEEGESERGELERLQKENKDLQTKFSKAEFDAKKLVRIVKQYSEKNEKLQQEVNKLHLENDQLVGHKNPSQKIQHHLKIKEENNKLREENYKFQEEIRRKNDLIFKFQGHDPQFVAQDMPQDEQFSAEEVKKLQKEVHTFSEMLAKLTEHVINEAKIGGRLGMNDAPATSVIGRAKQAMQIVSLLSNVMNTKEKEVVELGKEKKR